MYHHCPNCNLKYERAPGYFLGSAYINYGATAVLVTLLYINLHFFARMSNQVLAAPLGLFCVLFPLFFFRIARSLWLGMDFYFDVTGFQSDED